VTCTTEPELNPGCVVPSIVTGALMDSALSPSWIAKGPGPAMSKSISLGPSSVFAASIASRRVHSLIVQPSAVCSAVVLTMYGLDWSGSLPPVPKQAENSDVSPVVESVAVAVTTLPLELVEELIENDAAPLPLVVTSVVVT